MTELRDEVRLKALARVEESVERLVDAVVNTTGLPDTQADGDAIRQAVRDELAKFDPVLDDVEHEAMEHLYAFAAIVQGRWHLRTNHEELGAAIHVLQGYVIGHMLKRLAPESWAQWYAEDVEETIERALGARPAGEDLEQPAGVDLVKVQILGNWLQLATDWMSPNWAGITAAVDRESLRALLMSNPLPGNFRDVTPALADYMIGRLGVAERIGATLAEGEEPSA